MFKNRRIQMIADTWRSASVPSGAYPEAPRGVYPKKRPCLASGLYSGDTTSTQAAPLSESSTRQTRESRQCTQPPPRCDSRADLTKRRCLACESCRHHTESGLAPLLHAPLLIPWLRGKTVDSMLSIPCPNRLPKGKG